MPDESKPEMRNVPRRRMVRAAITLFDRPESPIPCVLLDISATGARINVHDVQQSLPAQFRLVVESEAIDKACEVVWRRGEEIGTRFIP